MGSNSTGLYPNIQLIDRVENRREGSNLNSFYTACGIQQDQPFLVVPLPSTVTTTDLRTGCFGGSPTGGVSVCDNPPRSL